MKKKKKSIVSSVWEIAANEAFEKVSSYGLQAYMIIYLMKYYGMSSTKGTNLCFLWTAATNFTPTIGAFLADSYLGRFLTIALGSLISLLVILFSFFFLRLLLQLALHPYFFFSVNWVFKFLIRQKFLFVI